MKNIIKSAAVLGFFLASFIAIKPVEAVGSSHKKIEDWSCENLPNQGGGICIFCYEDGSCDIYQW